MPREPRQFTVDVATLQPLDVPLSELSPDTPTETQAQTSVGGGALRSATNMLPTALATGASLLGAGKSNPVGMALAGVGGVGGEAWRQTLQALQGNWDEVPPTMRDQLQAMVEEGLKQGGVEGFGRFVLGPMLRMLGRGAYQSALKPGVDIKRDFAGARPMSGGREVTKTLIDLGVPITRTGAGTEKAMRALAASGDDTMQTLAAAEAAGAKPVTMRPVVQSLNRTRDTMADRVVRSGPLDEVAQIRDAALRENPGRIPLTRAQAMKQAEQNLAIQGYKAEAKGATVNSVDLNAHEDLARGLKEAIERRVPGIRNKNLRTQRLIGAVKAISNAEGRIANNNLIGMGDMLAFGSGAFGGSVMGPEGAAIGVIQEVLTRPEIASRLGIALDRTGKPLVTPQALRLLNEALSSLSGEE